MFATTQRTMSTRTSMDLRVHALYMRTRHYPATGRFSQTHSFIQNGKDVVINGHMLCLNARFNCLPGRRTFYFLFRSGSILRRIWGSLYSPIFTSFAITPGLCTSSMRAYFDKRKCLWANSHAKERLSHASLCIQTWCSPVDRFIRPFSAKLEAYIYIYGTLVRHVQYVTFVRRWKRTFTNGPNPGQKNKALIFAETYVFDDNTLYKLAMLKVTVLTTTNSSHAETFFYHFIFHTEIDFFTMTHSSHNETNIFDNNTF
jgi:hypothetical protein